MSKFGKELIESMQQAADYSCGRKVRGMRVTAVEVPDVKPIRAKLRTPKPHRRRAPSGEAK